MSEYSIVKDWSDLLQEIAPEHRDVYFSIKYFSVYESVLDSAECFVYRSNNDIYLLPYLKRAHPFEGDVFFDFESPYGYGGPLSNTRDPGFLRQAQRALFEASRSSGIIAGFVGFSPWLKNQSLVSDCTCLHFDRKTVAMDLAVSESDIWMKQIHSKHRNVIRKAEREGLTFQIDKNFDFLDAFVELYRGTMARINAHEFYFFSDAHFSNLVKSLRGHAFLGVVRSAGRIVSAAIFLYDGAYGHYHLAGSDPAYQYLAPNNFMIFQAALYLKSVGVKRFHLGGGDDASESNSLFKFKRRFSPECLDFYIGKFVFDPQMYTRVCNQWERDFPDKSIRYGHRLLKYRY